MCDTCGLATKLLSGSVVVLSIELTMVAP